MTEEVEIIEGEVSVTPRGRGAVSTYTDEVAARICELTSEGMMLAEICRMPGMPSQGTVYNWRRERPAFADALARAREDLTDCLIEKAIDISNDESRDTLEGRWGDIPNSAAVARDRLRIDTLKFFAEKLNPKKYGTNKVEISGNEEAPLVIQLGPVDSNL